MISGRKSSFLLGILLIIIMGVIEIVVHIPLSLHAKYKSFPLKSLKLLKDN